jgi:phosphonate transport system substrate-binding protein
MLSLDRCSLANTMRRIAWLPLLRAAFLPFLIVLTVFASTSAASAENKPRTKEYLFGAFPHVAVPQIEAMFGPVAEDFSRVLRREVVLRTRPSFEKFMQELAAETYDIALVHPFDYVWAHDQHGYLPLVRRGDLLSAQIMVTKTSPFTQVSDLKGKKLGLPPNVAAVSYLVKGALVKAGLDLNKDINVANYRTHESCLQQLLIGAIDACGSAMYPVRFFEAKWHPGFRILAESDAIPQALFIVHPRVPVAEREILTQAILAWTKNGVAQELVEYGGLSSFKRTSDADYDVVRDYLKRISAPGR